MKIILHTSQNRQRGGWALLITMVLATAGTVLLTGVMNWSMQNSALAARNDEYFTTTYAAESATEKARAAITADFENYGAGLVAQNMANYLTMMPTATDNSYWTNYTFSGGTTVGQMIITNTVTSNAIVLGPPFTGLSMAGTTYEIIANAQNKSSLYQITATVGQTLSIGTIPLFQFAIFYQQDLEINPGATMTVSGPVHGNSQIYAGAGGANLTFADDVSAVDAINQNESPLDPSARGGDVVNFDAYHLPDQAPINLPVGTNTAGTATNVAANVDAILQIPSSGQGPGTSVGTNMLYNNADLIVLVSNGVTVVQTGPGTSSPNTVISSNAWSGFITTNTFYDQRQGMQIDGVVLNVSNLNNWVSTNTTLYGQLGNRTLQSLYVADERNTTNTVVSTYTTTNYSGSMFAVAYPTGQFLKPVFTNSQNITTTTNPVQTSPIWYFTPTIHTNGHYNFNYITGYTYTNYYYTTNTTTNYPEFAQPGVYLTNGAILPSTGLSVVTPDPAYIVGNWNVQSNHGGTSDAGLNSTAYTLPSAIYADAVTILSSGWNPNNSTAAIGSRTATSDTVNAAILTGNVPSNGSYYSGGVENFLRFLENWSNQTLTYNGSLVCMFSSQIATAPWPGTGTVYNPPTRNWAFDVNFENPNKLPPLTPRATAVVRGKWTTLAPQSVRF
jgi:hypothetical protein